MVIVHHLIPPNSPFPLTSMDVTGCVIHSQPLSPVTPSDLIPNLSYMSLLQKIQSDCNAEIFSNVHQALSCKLNNS